MRDDVGYAPVRREPPPRLDTDRYRTFSNAIFILILCRMDPKRPCTGFPGYGKGKRKAPEKTACDHFYTLYKHPPEIAWHDNG